MDFIDESEVLTPADEVNHVYKHDFGVPFVCGCRNLGEALRRIGEGAAMIRTKGEAGTGDVVHAVRHLREVWRDIRNLTLVGKDAVLPEGLRVAASAVIGHGAGPDDFTSGTVGPGAHTPNRTWYGEQA